ncbi:MAG: hypothetical protein K8R25_17895 [Methanosarcinales archaeon]|nr:hypothetical protein [Methanosarcinales archaeon]
MKQIIYIIVAVLVIIVAYLGMMLLNTDEETVTIREHDYPEILVSGISLALIDNNTSQIEEILDDQLPFSYTIEKKDGYGDRDYTVIPLSDFNSLKGTILNNENIVVKPVKQEDGNIYVFVNLLGDSDRNATNKLQEHLEKYSLEVKKINWFYVGFSDNILYKEIKYTTNQLKNESNAIHVYPDYLYG